MECLVLKKEEVSENDFLVAALFRDGQLRTGLAKSSRFMQSRMRSALSPLTISDISFHPALESKVIISAFSLMEFSGFKKSPEFLGFGLALLDFIAEHGEGAGSVLYLNVSLALRNLNTSLVARESNLRLYRKGLAACLGVFKSLGAAPILDRCGKCFGKKELAGLSVETNGAVCGLCAKGITHYSLTPDATRALSANKMPVLKKDSIKLAEFLDSFINWHFPVSSEYVRPGYWLGKKLELK